LLCAPQHPLHKKVESNLGLKADFGRINDKDHRQYARGDMCSLKPQVAIVASQIGHNASSCLISPRSIKTWVASSLESPPRELECCLRARC
jgi:hypothetical protein